MARVDLKESPCAEHLRGRQSHPAMSPHNLPEGIVRKAGHGRLEKRRVNDQGANFQRTNHESRGRDRRSGKHEEYGLE